MNEGKNFTLDFYKVLDQNRVEELRLKRNDGYIDFLFRRDDSTLTVSGSYDYAVFCWYSSRNTLKEIAEYAKDLRYFTSKCVAFDYEESPIVYPEKKVKEDLMKTFNNTYLSKESWNYYRNEARYSTLLSWDTREELICDLSNCFDYIKGFNPAFYTGWGTDAQGIIDALDTLEIDLDDYSYIGATVNPFIKLYSRSLSEGIQLINEAGLTIPPIEGEEK